MPFSASLCGDEMNYIHFCMEGYLFLFLFFVLRQVLHIFWVPGSMLSRFSAFLLSLLLCFCASVPFYFY